MHRDEGLLTSARMASHSACMRAVATCCSRNSAWLCSTRCSASMKCASISASLARMALNSARSSSSMSAGRIHLRRFTVWKRLQIRAEGSTLSALPRVPLLLQLGTLAPYEAAGSTDVTLWCGGGSGCQAGRVRQLSCCHIQALLQLPRAGLGCLDFMILSQQALLILLYRQVVPLSS